MQREKLTQNEFFKMDLNEINKLADNFKKDFDKLINFQGQLLAQLPEEHAKQRAEIQNDIEGVIGAVKNNDLTKLNELVKKYGDNNN
jgi:hypothetical protein